MNIKQTLPDSNTLCLKAISQIMHNGFPYIWYFKKYFFLMLCCSYYILEMEIVVHLQIKKYIVEHHLCVT